MGEAVKADSGLPNYSFEMGFIISAREDQTGHNFAHLVTNLARDFNHSSPPHHPRMVENLVLERDASDRSRWSISRIGDDPHIHYRIHEMGYHKGKQSSILLPIGLGQRN